MTANAERMRLNSTGLGIGTSSPSRQLTVSGSTAPVIAIVDTGTSGTPSLFFGDSSADNVGKIQYSNSDNSLATVVNGSERMRIDSSGNVGISNTTPGDFNSQARNLVIGGGSGDTGMTIYSGSGSGDTGNIFFADGSSGSDQVRGGITYNHGDNSMNFRTNDGANRIYISSAGNVGINTSSPSVKLHILGTENNADTQAIRLMENSTQGGFIKYDGNTNELQLGGYNSGENTGIKIARNDATTMFNTGGSERMRIDSSGRAMIGTTTADGILAVSDTNNETYLVVQNAKSGGSGEAVLSLKNDVGNYQVKCFTDDSFRIRDNTNSTDRLMISSGGTVFVSNTSEPSAGDNGAQISNSSYHIFCRNTSGAAVFRTFGSSGEFRTLGNGNAQNTNNSYGAISDRELKENEVDANSQWNDIKSLQIKHYNFKSKPNEKQLGVIAQDLEASGMNGLVENNQDELYTEDDVLPEGKNIGDVKLKNYKSVKYSILYMKSVKALQEAMTRIESLEARITALENA